MRRRLGWCLLPLLLLLTGCSIYGVSIPPTAGPWLALSPGTGQPGTRLTVSGGRVATASDQRLVLCWNGCQRGLRLLVATRRGGPNGAVFSATLTVPSVPWLEEGGPHAVSSGAYAVSATCLTAGSYCQAADGYARAVFNLLIKTANPACTPGHRCVQLALAQRPVPGQAVQMRGQAPLTSGSFAPGGYQVWATAGAGALTGLWRGPPTGHAVVLGLLAQTWQGKLNGDVTWPRAFGPGPVTLWLVSPRFPDGRRLALAALVVTPLTGSPP